MTQIGLKALVTNLTKEAMPQAEPDQLDAIINYWTPENNPTLYEYFEPIQLTAVEVIDENDNWQGSYTFFFKRVKPFPQEVLAYEDLFLDQNDVFNRCDDGEDMQSPIYTYRLLFNNNRKILQVTHTFSN